MHRETRVLARVAAAVGQDGVEASAAAGAAEDEVAALEDGGRVAEDVVDGAEDVALAVELAEGESVERVLVAGDAASV